MSNKATRLAWKIADSSNLSSAAVLVLTALAHFHNQETGRCNPSVSRISKRTKQGRRTVQRAIFELTAAKILKVVMRKDRCKSGTINRPNSYVFLGGGGVTMTRGVVSQWRTSKETVKTREVPSAFYDLANLIDDDD